MPLSVMLLRLSNDGPDVAILHRALESLSRRVDVDERRRRLFGPATEALLRELQAQSGLPTTGICETAVRPAAAAGAAGRRSRRNGLHHHVAAADEHVRVGAHLHAAEEHAPGGRRRVGGHGTRHRPRRARGS